MGWGGVRAPLGEELLFHLVVGPHGVTFYITPRQSINKLASEVAAKGSDGQANAPILFVCYASEAA